MHPASGSLYSHSRRVASSIFWNCLIKDDLSSIQQTILLKHIKWAGPVVMMGNSVFSGVRSGVINTNETQCFCSLFTILCTVDIACERKLTARYFFSSL